MATAEILREPSTLADAADAIDFPVAPPSPTRATAPAPLGPTPMPTVPSLTEAATRLYGPGGTREQEAEMARIRANALRPEYAKINEAMATRERVAAAPPAIPTLQAPPSRGLRDFLAPAENESPIASIAKLIQAMSLFANVAVGGSRHNAVGALAAFTGAMKGWQEGDAMRADRAFADWQAKTQTALKEYDLQRTAYTDAMTGANVSLDARMRAAQLKALESGDIQAAMALESKNLEEFLTFQAGRDDAQSKLAIEVQKMIEARGAREAQIEEARARRAESDARAREMMEFRKDTQAWREQEAAARRDDATARRAEDAARRAEGARVPVGQLEALADMRSFVKQLDDVKAAFDPKYTGPVADWIKWAKSKSVGLEKPEEQFRAMLSNFENTLLKLRSGAAITEQEYSRLKRELPTTADPSGKFLAKLETTRTLMAQVLSTREATYREFGYRVPAAAGASGWKVEEVK